MGRHDAHYVKLRFTDRYGNQYGAGTPVHEGSQGKPPGLRSLRFARNAHCQDRGSELGVLRVRDRGMEGDRVIILPRSKVAHLAAGCHHWICLGAGSAEVDGIEVCGMCAASITAEEHQAMISNGDGQQHD
jgi:hypothetical protein